jgi:SAM-dependent methyltransferase
MMQSSVCNICGGALRTRFSAVLDPQTRETFAVNECTACGFGHTVIHAKDLSRYYGDYHGGRHGLTASYCARRRLQLMARAASAGTQRRLLDVGCGDGTFLLAAQEKGWRVVGTEANPRIAQAAGLDVRSSLAELQGLAPFDCITLWHSLEHMRDPVALLSALSLLLAFDGTILVAVPNAGGLQSRLFGPKWFHLDVPRHLYHFGRRSLASLFERSGIVITHRWHQELEYDLLGWSQSALNAIMPTPNVFFNVLTGRNTWSGYAWRMANCVLGAVSLAAALPLTFVSTLFQSGGTLIFAGRQKVCDRS